MATLRPFRAGDEPGIAALVDAGIDPLYVTQAHPLHGPDRDGQRFRRTVVAIEPVAIESVSLSVGVKIVGAVSVCANPLHPGRYVMPLVVGEAARGRGVGRALVDAARQARPEPRPLAAKIRPLDGAARALLTAVAGRVYQESPGAVVDVTDPGVIAWADAHARMPGAGLVGPDEVDADRLAPAWAELYRWVHESWSPVGAESELAEVADDESNGADPDVSVLAVRNGRIMAAAWAYEANEGNYELVCETTRRHEPAGDALVAAVLGECIRRAASAGGQEIEIDGHVSDPHLAAVLAELPIVRHDPVLLVEVD